MTPHTKSDASLTWVVSIIIIVVNKYFLFFLLLFTVYMPGRNVMNGDCGLGHLTFVGYKQQLLNGQNLQKAYVDIGFLSNYSHTDVFLRSDGR